VRVRVPDERRIFRRDPLYEEFDDVPHPVRRDRDVPVASAERPVPESRRQRRRVPLEDGAALPSLLGAPAAPTLLVRPPRQRHRVAVALLEQEPEEGPPGPVRPDADEEALRVRDVVPVSGARPRRRLRLPEVAAPGRVLEKGIEDEMRRRRHEQNARPRRRAPRADVLAARLRVPNLVDLPVVRARDQRVRRRRDGLEEHRELERPTVDEHVALAAEELREPVLYGRDPDQIPAVLGAHLCGREGRALADDTEWVPHAERGQPRRTTA
jgi:hypothetical protein